jgi:arylesterase/paraoxonase
VYDRYIAACVLLANRPGKLQAVNGFKSYEIKFRDRIRNCEDVILEESEGVAILSCDAGRDRWNTVMVSFCFSSTCYY